jgi:DNA-binding GntR family transcriptional regulator
MAVRSSRPGDAAPQRSRGGRTAAQIDRLPPRLKGTRPLGQQLEEILEGLIAGSAPGDPIPSERALAERYRVARMTARQAIETMLSKGLVYRQQGSGTFVAEAKLVQPERLTSFSEDIRARGMTPGATVLRREVGPAPSMVASRLRLAQGTDVVTIERLRTADAVPLALETAYLPAARFPGLERVNLAGSSLYALLQIGWGVEVRAADQWLAPTGLTPEQARLLCVPPDTPAFRFQRLTYDGAGVPIEYVLSLYRGDRYEVHMRLERRTLLGG